MSDSSHNVHHSIADNSDPTHSEEKSHTTENPTQKEEVRAPVAGNYYNGGKNTNEDHDDPSPPPPPRKRISTIEKRGSSSKNDYEITKAKSLDKQRQEDAKEEEIFSEKVITTRSHTSIQVPNDPSAPLVDFSQYCDSQPTAGAGAGGSNAGGGAATNNGGNEATHATKERPKGDSKAPSTEPLPKKEDAAAPVPKEEKKAKSGSLCC